MDICPTLEQIYRTAQLRPTKSLRNAPLTFHVTDAAQPYVLQVHDKYRQADMPLVRRLGEANWQRYKELRRDKHAIAAGADAHVPKAEIPKSVFRPVSGFHDSGLGTSLLAKSQIAISVASHSSFQSGAAGDDRHQMRVPKTPEEVALGKPFDCYLCHRTLSTLRNRVDWK
jgi:hypothetical protein